tara:strand:+ start:538 stop:723 length:186 start_codon:yes stop_codon:yes gene_type:complete
MKNPYKEISEAEILRVIQGLPESPHDIISYTDTNYIFRNGNMIPMERFDEAMKDETHNTKQ